MHVPHLPAEFPIEDVPCALDGHPSPRCRGVGARRAVRVPREGHGLVQHQNLRRDHEGVVLTEPCAGVQHGGGRGEVAPPVGLLLAGEAVPRVAPDRLGLVAQVGHAEPVAGKAVPLGAGAAG
eukprot:scaffold572968_cov38-Prasinocladus_malaysianus.AAC.1